MSKTAFFRSIVQWAAILVPFLATASGPGQVIVQGRMLATGGDLGQALLVVEVDGEACHWAHVSAKGHFRVELPEGVQARLIFSGPDRLPKEVLLDTQRALDGSEGDRRLAFDVRLESLSRNEGMGYAGPVGHIDFIRGSGALKVERSIRSKAHAHERE
ncbi:MAG: hypothetical protein KDC02_11525 [Flavobacteriales bacterium]|nr:hypothetical protein [Flavobacteriales bacterium]